MNKQRPWAQAFTIIEVLIVLAVTSALLVAAIAVISGQQRKTEFEQAIRDVESQINDVINDVSTGFYPDTNNFSCAEAGGAPSISAVAAGQGTNQDCLFAGRVLQFGVAGDPEKFNIFTVVGLRQVGGRDVTNLDEAEVRAVAPTPSTDTPSNTETKTLQYGLTINKMTYKTSVGGAATDIGAVGFFSTFDASGNLASGTPSVDVLPIGGTVINQNPELVAQQINGITDAGKNPGGGFELCFQSGGTNQYGIITIGSNNRQLTTKLEIKSGVCP